MIGDWELRPLGEVSTGPLTVNPKDRPDEEFRYVDVSAVSNRSFAITDTDTVLGRDAPGRARRQIRTGDVLFATIRPALQRIALVPEELDSEVCSTGFCVLRPSPEMVLPKFVFYWLLTPEFTNNISALQRGASYPAVADREVRSQVIPVPPLAEQDRIVGILDDGLARIRRTAERTQASHDAASRLTDSLLHELLNTESAHSNLVPLGRAASIARGGSPRPIKEYLTSDREGINWIKIGDATASGKYIYRTAQKIKPEGVGRSRLVHSGDLLLSNSMSFGRPYIMRTSGCIHDGWLVLSDYSETFDQDYLYYVLGSDYVYRQFDSLAAGSTVRNLNIDLAGRVVIPAPPIESQRQIASKLEEVEARVSALMGLSKTKEDALERLGASLLHQAFSGRL